MSSDNKEMGQYQIFKSETIFSEYRHLDIDAVQTIRQDEIAGIKRLVSHKLPAQLCQLLIKLHSEP